jgi:hypothetical protein
MAPAVRLPCVRVMRSMESVAAFPWQQAGQVKVKVLL